VHALSRWLTGLFVSPGGIVALAALDSTVFFSFPFGIDAAVVLEAARLHDWAWLVPLLATAGSLAGAWVTFWMGTKIGKTGLERFVPSRRLEGVRRRVDRTGAVGLAMLDLVPPPFPYTAFLLAAGALEVAPGTFFTTLAVCRMIRFGGETVLAVSYGAPILAWLDTDAFFEVGAILILAAVFVAGAGSIRFLHGRRHAGSRRAA
jgi:membrane protein YqaA with SNARE-associated domain